VLPGDLVLGPLDLGDLVPVTDVVVLVTGPPIANRPVLA
jgi:hypothetical protein